MGSESAVLFQNDSRTTAILDLPRSIEEAQVLSSQLSSVGKPKKAPVRRLVSALPPASPFVTPEPKKRGREPLLPTSSARHQLDELMSLAAVESALQDIAQSGYSGPWCLPRCLPPPSSMTPRHREKEAKTETARATEPAALVVAEARRGTGECDTVPAPAPVPATPSTTGIDSFSSTDDASYFIPDASRYFLGTIESQREAFLSAAAPESLGLIVMDPPWPNRSAKRKRGAYQPADGFGSIRTMLSLIPVASHLAPGGLVAVWVTNSEKSVDLLTSSPQGGGGVFAAWDVELVGEWTWLKVTSQGEPIVSLDSSWRKPWERLLIARKRGGPKKQQPIHSKVIITVPDVHSRKPNLRRLFDELLPPGYRALEVFARSLTAGWLSWGDQVLLFQQKDHWLSDPAAVDAEENGNKPVENYVH
ncbi:MT-A70-domain-containing protein [Podospora didyma]|uniref:MT-A70-domain-containing protein n=1 Tax=Podospora didyma TaxID=330526 RepID=A0AAE0P080_9PEZI|nr:MT-A70-domain-containing protein [Podospora didyma]